MVTWFPSSIGLALGIISAFPLGVARLMTVEALSVEAVGIVIRSVSFAPVTVKRISKLVSAATLESISLVLIDCFDYSCCDEFCV